MPEATTTTTTEGAGGAAGGAGAGAGGAGAAGAGAGAGAGGAAVAGAAGGAAAGAGAGGAAGGAGNGAQGDSKTLITGGDAAGAQELKVPEGREIDGQLFEGFKAWAKEAKIETPVAQKLVDLFAQRQQAQDKEVADVREQWLKDTKSDKEIGGTNLEKSVANAQKALVRFGSDGLKAFLTETSLGNHPELVRFFNKVGAALAEDKAGSTFAGGPPPKGKGPLGIYNHPTSQQMSGMDKE